MAKQTIVENKLNVFVILAKEVKSEFKNETSGRLWFFDMMDLPGGNGDHRIDLGRHNFYPILSVYW